jgi:hypothetical protein
MFVWSEEREEANASGSVRAIQGIYQRRDRRGETGRRMARDVSPNIKRACHIARFFAGQAMIDFISGVCVGLFGLLVIAWYIANRAKPTQPQVQHNGISMRDVIKNIEGKA